MIQIPQSTSRVVMLKLYLSSDHISVATGKTVAIKVSKNGGAFADPNAGATNATEVSNGWYKVTVDTTDTGTLGDLVVRGTATSCDDTERVFGVVKATTGGLTALPDTAATTNASLLTSGTGTDQLSVSAGKVLLQATQTGVTIPTVTTVTNQLTAAAIATGVWQDTTAGDFTVASSIGKSLYTSGAVPGAAGGLFIAGTNAATTVTTSFTTTFTGNLTGSVGSVSGAVGSVTGAVGSVTGNVGGNVVGSVGSVTGNVGGTVATVTTLTNLPAAPTDWLTAAAVKADAVTKIQAGLSTYAGGDTSGTTTLLNRVTATRAGYLDNLSGGAVMLASTYAAPPTAAANAAAWGARDLGFGVTADEYLQGYVPRIVFAADGLTATVYCGDDTTVLQSLTATRLATTVGGLRSTDPV